MPRIKTACETLILGLLCLVLASCGSTTHDRNSHYFSLEKSITVDTGGIHVGPWRMNRSDWRYVDNPVVDVSGPAEAGVAWVDQNRKDILFQFFRVDGTRTPENPVNVSGTPGVFSWYPDLVVDSTAEPSRVYVLWQEIVFSGGSHGGDIFFARSTDGGRTFESPINLSRSPEGDGKGRINRQSWDNGSLDLAMGPDGNLHAVWTEYEGSLLWARSTDQGGSFTDPVRLNDRTSDSPARGPSVDVGEDGNAVVAWTVGEDSSANIHLRTIESKTDTPGTTKLVHESSGFADAPKLAVDEAGGTVHVSYSESPRGPGGPYQIRYARAPDWKSDFEEPRLLKPSGTDGVKSYHYSSMTLDGAGNPYLLWELFPMEKPRRSRGLGLIASTDGGNSFGPPEVVPGTLPDEMGFNGGLQGKLTNKIDVEGENVALVNSMFYPDERSRVSLYWGILKQ